MRRPDAEKLDFLIHPDKPKRPFWVECHQRYLAKHQEARALFSVVQAFGLHSIFHGRDSVTGGVGWTINAPWFISVLNVSDPLHLVTIREVTDPRRRGQVDIFDQDVYLASFDIASGGAQKQELVKWLWLYHLKMEKLRASEYWSRSTRARRKRIHEELSKGRSSRDVRTGPRVRLERLSADNLRHVRVQNEDKGRSPFEMDNVRFRGHETPLEYYMDKHKGRLTKPSPLSLQTRRSDLSQSDFMDVIEKEPKQNTEPTIEVSGEICESASEDASVHVSKDVAVFKDDASKSEDDSGHGTPDEDNATVVGESVTHRMDQDDRPGVIEDSGTACAHQPQCSSEQLCPAFDDPHARILQEKDAIHCTQH